MAFDLVPRNLFSFPNLPGIWEDEDLLIPPSAQSGLSISEDEKNIFVETALPGIDPRDIDVTFQDGYLWIRGEAKEEEQNKKKKYYRRAQQSFSYRVAVPGDIDPNIEPEANYKHGIMTVKFAKSPKSQPKKIQIKSVNDKK